MLKNKLFKRKCLSGPLKGAADVSRMKYKHSTKKTYTFLYFKQTYSTCENKHKKNKHERSYENASNVSPSPIQTILSVPDLHQVHRSFPGNAIARSCQGRPGSRTDEKTQHAG